MKACVLFELNKWNTSDLSLQFIQFPIKIVELVKQPAYPDYVCLYVQVKEKTPVWQIAVNLESENIITGYGFGNTFSEAQSEAISTLKRRLSNHELRRMTYSK